MMPPNLTPAQQAAWNRLASSPLRGGAGGSTGPIPPGLVPGVGGGMNVTPEMMQAMNYSAAQAPAAPMQAAPSPVPTTMSPQPVPQPQAPMAPASTGQMPQRTVTQTLTGPSFSYASPAQPRQDTSALLAALQARQIQGPQARPNQQAAPQEPAGGLAFAGLQQPIKKNALMTALGR